MRLKLNVKMAAIRNTQYAIRNAGQKYAIRKMLKNTQLLNTLRMAYLTLMVPAIDGIERLCAETQTPC